MAKKFGSPDLVIGEFTRIEVDLIDFQRAAVEIAQLANYIENVELPLRAVARIAREDIAERFETETAPDGSTWFPLDEDYAKRKLHDKGFEHPILTRGGELRDKATDKDNWTVGEDSIWYSTSDLPPYWRVHQDGSEDFGAVFHQVGDTNVLVRTSEAGQNIPPRPFIGLSDDAEDKVLDLFDIWFSEGLEQATKRYAISSAGTLHNRTPAGRFGARIIF